MALAQPRISLIPEAGSVSASAARRNLEGYRWLLALRFALLNLTGLALVGAAWMQGWLDEMIATDTYHLIKLNVGVFITGLAICAGRVAKLSQELNQLDARPPEPGTRIAAYLGQARHTDSGGRAILADSLKMRLGVRLGTIRHIANSLVLIGLVGTVIGFIIALSAVDPGAASDPSQIGPMVATLLRGMSMALFKTLLGSILNVWLMLNYRLLEGGAVHVVARAIEAGERHADV